MNKDFEIRQHFLAHEELKKIVRMSVFIGWLSENLRKNKSRPKDSREYSKEHNLAALLIILIQKYK